MLDYILSRPEPYLIAALLISVVFGLLWEQRQQRRRRAQRQQRENALLKLTVEGQQGTIRALQAQLDARAAHHNYLLEVKIEEQAAEIARLTRALSVEKQLARKLEKQLARTA